MKRIFSLCIVLALILTLFSGCALSNKLTAFGLYTRAVRTISKAGGFEIASTISVTFDEDLLAGAEITMFVNIKQNGKNSRTEIKTGDETAAVTTIIGRDVYVESALSKLRYTMPEKESSKADPSAIPEIAEDLFANLDVIKNEDGSKSITLSLEDEALYNLVSQMSGGELDEFEGISFENAQITMNFDVNNDLDTMQVSCDVSYNVFGLFELKGRMDSEYKFINLGVAPEVTTPVNAAEFEFAGEYIAQ